MTGPTPPMQPSCELIDDPAMFAWIIQQAAQRGERWVITLHDDLPALALSCGDRLTLRPQTRWDCCSIYLLRSGELARISISDFAGRLRVLRQNGDLEFWPHAEVHAQALARVAAHETDGRDKSVRHS
jgi:hypothetical protein